MFGSRFFRIAFILSIAAHGALLIHNPNFNFLNKVDRDKTSELTYIQPIKQKVEKKKENARMEPFLKLPRKISVDKRIPPPFVQKTGLLNKERGAVQKNISVTKPVFASPDVIAVKKKITLPPVDINKINNASYISYYQLVREKIKRAAYRNYTLNEEGEIYVSFVISNSGALAKLKVIEEKSTSSQFLRNVALSSVRDASSFPAFPSELNYPQLSFNVVISFEIE